MKRILFIADSIKRKTGYATVARNIISRLLETQKFDIGLLGLADIHTQLDLPISYYTQIKNHKKCCKKGHVVEHRTANDPTIKYITSNIQEPLHSDQKLCLKGTNENTDNYAYDSIYFVIQHFKPDIVIPINDIWGLYNINYIRNRKCFKFIPYLAIDSECMFPGLDIPNGRPGLPGLDTIKTISGANEVIVFTEWAQNVINKVFKTVTGRTFDKMSTIPHGVDTKIWKPIETPKKELKKKFFNIEEDIFLIGVVARNQPRKKLDAALQTLKKFIDHYEKPGRKAYMYFHCSLDDKLGWPLDWIAHYYGVRDRCIFDKRLKPGMGPSDEQFNELVNSFDVHMLLTNSEGWGLPLLETAAAGIPNLTTKYSAHGDWGKDTLMFCKTAELEHEIKTGFIKCIADTSSAAKQLSLLYNSKELYKDYCKKGIKLGQKLDWDNVVKQWETFLDNVNISDLKENRYSDPSVFPQTNDPNDMTLTVFPTVKAPSEDIKGKDDV